MLVNKSTPSEKLEAVQLGDTLSYQSDCCGGFTGTVFQIFKGINAGMMEYSFYLAVEGYNFTHYIFERRRLD